MFGYQAFYALKGALVKFFYDEGDLLPTNQVDGIDHVYKLLDLYRNEVDTTLLNLGTKKKSLYLIELENQLSQFESPFGELYIPVYSLPQALEVSQKISLDANGNRSGQEVLEAICSRLFSEGMDLERQWTGGTIHYPNLEASAAFFAGLDAWQKVALRYKHVHNITLGIAGHIIAKRSIWGMEQQKATNTESTSIDNKPSEIPEDITPEFTKFQWKLTVQQLAELLYLAEKAGALNLKELYEKGGLPKAARHFCEGLSFLKTKDDASGKTLYEALYKIGKAGGLGPGKADYPIKNNPLGATFTKVRN